MTPEPLCRCGGVMGPQVVATGLEGKYRNLKARMQELASDRRDKIEYICVLEARYQLVCKWLKEADEELFRVTGKRYINGVLEEEVF